MQGVAGPNAENAPPRHSTPSVLPTSPTDVREKMSGGPTAARGTNRPAIVNETRAGWLADEPSANLDTATTEELLEVLRRLNSQRGVTILTATHDPMVMGYTTRQVNLRDGHVVDP